MSERDWIDVVTSETCLECGLAAAEIDQQSLSSEIREAAEQWSDWLRAENSDALRCHSAKEVWSALEYAGHVRDLLQIFAGRLARLLAEDGPELGWWDHEAAVTDQAYNTEDIASMASAIVANASELASRIDLVGSNQWGRTGVRRPGEVFTVDSLVRFGLHESRHHLRDARNQVGAST